MLRCADGTLYTGITNNLSRRLRQHTEGRGAKYTRGRGPFHIAFTRDMETKSSALRLEVKIKRLTKAQKEELLKG
jgi:putative endonuclease